MDRLDTPLAPFNVDGATLAGDGHRRDGAYAWYVTAALLAAYAFSFVDRQVMNLLVEPVRHALNLDDTHVSLLIGIAFVGAYALASPLGGRLADAGHRRTIILFAIAIWSLFTVGCGFANSYGWLFAMRFGVGATEACLMPAAWSLIADYFSREKLPRAMGLFLLGPYLGGGLALIIGSTLVKSVAGGTTVAGLAGWQLTFVVAGAIGLIPLLMMVPVREAPRPVSAQHGVAPPSITQVTEYFRRKWRVYGGFYVGISLQVITFYAFPAWVPTLIFRHFQIPLGTVGLHYGLITIVVGSIGVLSGPVLGRWLERRGHRDYNLRVAALSSTVIAPVAASLPFMPSYHAVLAVVAAVTFIGSLPMAMNAAALQTVTPNRMRGIAASIYMFTVSLIGVAIPPTLIALLTDHLFRDPGMVGWSIGIVCLGASVLAALALWPTLAHYRDAVDELARAGDG